jgi:hypothetical protein
MRLTVLLYLGSICAFAGNWSGILVDTKCYEAEERNVNPWEIDAAHDRNLEIRACRPGARTKLFTLVDGDGQSFRLDPSGNAKALDLVRTAAKNHAIAVSVKGELNNDTVSVDSITLSK